MHEILTLQFGSYASFIGSHYWNLQAATSTHNLNRYAEDESFIPYTDSTCLFRQGVDSKTGQVTSYNPRVVIFEKQNELGILSTHGISTLGSSDMGALKSKDFVRRQLKALSGEQNEPEVWIKKRYSGDSSEYIQDLNQIPKYSEWNSILGENIVDESLKNEKYIPDDLKENPGDWASIHKWNRGDLEIDDNKSLESESAMNTQELIHGNSIDKLEQIRNDLQLNVKRWTDFFEPILHSKSVCPIQDELILYNDFSNETKTLLDEDYFDRIRFFLEESDYLQGIQTFVNANDGWSSISNRIIENIKDEVGGKKPIIVFTCSEITPEEMSDNDLKTLRLNFAAGLGDLYEKVDMVVPLTAFACNNNQFPGVHFVDESSYSTSSLLASALDSVTSSYRKFKYNNEMYKLINTLQPRSSHRISALSASFPIPIFEKQTLFNFYKTLEPIHLSPYFSTLSPYNRSSFASPPIAHSIVVKGLNKIPLYEVKAETFSGIKQGMTPSEIQQQIKLLMKSLGQEEPFKSSRNQEEEDSILSNCNSHSEMLEKYLSQTRTYEKTYDISPDPTFLSPSFPNVFSYKELNNLGFRRRNEPLERDVVASIPSITQLETTSGIVPYIKELSSILKSSLNMSDQIGFAKDLLVERQEILNMAADDYDLDS